MSRTSFWEINILKLLHQPHQSAEAPPTRTTFLPQTYHEVRTTSSVMKTQNKVGKQGYPYFPLWTSRIDICMIKTSWRERSWLCHLNNSLFLCCPWLLVKQNQKHENREVNQTKPKKFPCRPWIWVFIKLIS